jgi:hypothetical protein
MIPARESYHRPPQGHVRAEALDQGQTVRSPTTFTGLSRGSGPQGVILERVGFPPFLDEGGALTMLEPCDVLLFESAVG